MSGGHVIILTNQLPAMSAVSFRIESGSSWPSPASLGGISSDNTGPLSSFFSSTYIPARDLKNKTKYFLRNNFLAGNFHLRSTKIEKKCPNEEIWQKTLFSDRWEKKFVYVYVYISILSQPVQALTHFCCVLSQETVNINFDPPVARTHNLPHSRQPLHHQWGQKKFSNKTDKL